MPTGEISYAVDALGRDDTCDALRDYFDACENQMGWSLERMSELAGIPYDTLKVYRRCTSLPGFENIRKLIAIAPPSIGTLLLSGTGRSVAAVVPSNVADVKLNTRVSKVAAKLAEALEDGFVDHRERRTIVPDMRELRDAADGFIRQAHD